MCLPGGELLPALIVHADLAALVAFAVTHEHRAPLDVESLSASASVSPMRRPAGHPSRFSARELSWEAVVMPRPRIPRTRRCNQRERASAVAIFRPGMRVHKADPAVYLDERQRLDEQAPGQGPCALRTSGSAARDPKSQSGALLHIDAFSVAKFAARHPLGQL